MKYMLRMRRKKMIRMPARSSRLSRSNTARMPGRCTLTAAEEPSFNVALWTCPIDADATGL